MDAATKNGRFKPERRMRLKSHKQRRKGAVLPLVVICMVGLIGMVALAIDIGMIAIARSQCQNAADTAAMAGARTISGDKSNSYNYSAVPTNAVNAAGANKVLDGSVVTGTITTVNAYTYTAGNVKVE